MQRTQRFKSGIKLFTSAKENSILFIKRTQYIKITGSQIRSDFRHFDTFIVFYCRSKAPRSRPGLCRAPATIMSVKITVSVHRSSGRKPRHWELRSWDRTTGPCPAAASPAGDNPAEAFPVRDIPAGGNPAEAFPDRDTSAAASPCWG